MESTSSEMKRLHEGCVPRYETCNEMYLSTLSCLHVAW